MNTQFAILYLVSFFRTGHTYISPEDRQTAIIITIIIFAFAAITSFRKKDN